MKLSVLINLYGNKTLDETLKIMSEQGIKTVEVGAGGYPGKAHCDPEVLLADDAKLEEFKNTFKKYGITICALAAHGNPLHPDKATAEMYDKDFKNAVLLAASYRHEFVAIAGELPQDTDVFVWDEAAFHKSNAKQISDPLGVFRIILVSLYSFHPFGICNYDPNTAHFENVEHGNPILPGGLHTDIQTRILMKPIGKSVKIGIEGGKTFFLIAWL